MIHDGQWWLNLASFFGIAILSVPVWSLNFRRKRLQALRDADGANVTDADYRSKARAILIGRHEQHVANWRRIDEICLGVGYALLLGSAALRLVIAPA